MPLSLQESFDLAIEADFRQKAVAAFLRFAGTIGAMSDSQLLAAEPSRSALGLREVASRIFSEVRSPQGQQRLALVLASYTDLDPESDSSILEFARTAIVAMVDPSDVTDP